MAVPKRKMSRSNTRSRRSQWKATPVQLVPVRALTGETVEVPAHLAKAVKRGLIDPETLAIN